MSEHTYDHSGSCFKDCLANPFRPIGAKYPGEFSHQYSNLLGGHADHYVGYPGTSNSETPGQSLYDARIVATVPHWLDNLSGQSKAGITAGYVQQVRSDGWSKRLKMKMSNKLQELFDANNPGLKEFGTSSYDTSSVTATMKYLDCTRVKQYLAGDTSLEHVDSLHPPLTGPAQEDGGPVMSTTNITEFIRNAPIEVLRYTKFGIRITTDTPKEMVGGHYYYALVNGSEPANLSEIDDAGHLNLMTQDQCIESITATRGWKKVPCGNGALNIILNPMERRSFMYSQALLPSADDIRAHHDVNQFFPEVSHVDYIQKTVSGTDMRAQSRMSMGLWQKLILYSTARNTAFGTTNASVFVPLSIEFFYCVEYVPPIGTLAHLTATPPAGKSDHSKHGELRQLAPSKHAGQRKGAPARAPPRRNNIAAIAGQAAQLALPHLMNFAANRMRGPSNGNNGQGNGKSKKKKKHTPQQPARRQPQARVRGRRYR